MQYYREMDITMMVTHWELNSHEGEEEVDLMVVVVVAVVVVVVVVEEEEEDTEGVVVVMDLEVEEEGVDLVAIGVEEAVEGVVHPPGDQSTESSFQV